MKILLDISDSKAAFFMEVLKNFSFVKEAVPISSEKAELMKDMAESVKELNLVKAGQLKSRNAEDLIDEL